MIKSVLNKFSLLLISFIFLFSCAKNQPEKWNGKGFIKTVGKFKTVENYTIKIDKNKNIISYKIFNSKGKNIATSSKKISSIHRWYLFWEDGILWVYSGDIGSSFWNFNKTVIKEKVITYENQDNLPVSIPEAIKKDILE